MPTTPIDADPPSGRRNYRNDEGLRDVLETVNRQILTELNALRQDMAHQSRRLEEHIEKEGAAWLEYRDKLVSIESAVAQIAPAIAVMRDLRGTSRIVMAVCGLILAGWGLVSAGVGFFELVQRMVK